MTSKQYVYIARKFLSWRATEDPDAYLHLARVLGQGESWDDLLRHRHVVVLGEGGTGKTREFRQRAAELSSAGKTGFYVRVEELADAQLENLIDHSALERFRAWQSSAETAIFFLDALDEAKLTRKSLERALNTLSRSLGNEQHRASVLVACRPSDWRSRDDLQAFERFAGTAVHLVQLAPLDEKQVRTLAVHWDVGDVEAFLHAISEASADIFAGRPRDVEWLVEYWRLHGRLGSLREIIDSNIEQKVREKVDRDSSLSSHDARAGVTRLAGIATIAARYSFVLPDSDVTPEDRSTAIAPQDVLKEWTDRDLRQLLTLPICDEASYGRVRIHHRSVQEYLAACFLRDRLEAGLPRRQLNRLLFTGERLVVPRHLASVGAWLSLWDRQVRDTMLRTAPEVLIADGDPSGLPDPVRCELLRAYASRFVDRERLFHMFDHASLGRFGSHALAETIASLLATTMSSELRMTLLRLVTEGRIAACVPRALEFALDPQVDSGVRSIAVIAVAKAGSSTDRNALLQLIRAPARGDRDIAGVLASQLFPSTLTADGLIDLISRVDSATRHHSDSLGWFLESELPTLCDNKLRETLLRRLLPIVFPTSIGSTTSSERHWLFECVCGLIAAMLSDGAPASDLLMDALDHVRDSSTTNYEHTVNLQKIQEALKERVEVRRELFWRHVSKARWQSMETQPAASSWHDGYALVHIGKTDSSWLLNDVRGRAREDDKEVAFDALLIFQLADLEELERAVAGNRALEMKLREATAPRTPSPEILELERRRKEHQDQLERQTLQNREALHRDLASIRAGTNINALNHLYSVGHESGDGFSTLSLDKIARVYGKEIADAAALGTRTYWRSMRVPLPHERDSKVPNAIPNVALVGLAGIGLDIASGVDVSTLAEPLLAKAAQLAIWEIGVPPWLEQLAGLHPEIAREAWRPILEAEYRHRPTAGNNEAHLLHCLIKLDSRNEQLRRACSPLLRQLLQQGQAPRFDAQRMAVRPLLEEKEEWVGLAALLEARARESIADRERLVLFWCAWVQCNSDAAMSFLETHLSAILRNEAGLLLIAIASFLHDWGEGPLSLRLPMKRDVGALKRLIPLLYDHVRPNDDIEAHGPLGQRERAQMIRNTLVHWLAAIESEESEAALRSMAKDPRMVALRDWLSSLADQRRQLNVLPWSVEQAVKLVDGFVKKPANAADLYQVALDRLDDVCLEQEKGDFNYRELLVGADEKPIQKWLASQLEQQARGMYAVYRESEVDLEKKPDIRVTIPDHGPISVEIKIAERWSGPQLEGALRDQLVGQYMRAVSSNFGILFLVSGEPNRQWQTSDGKRLSLADFVDHLNRMASDLQATNPNVLGLRVLALFAGAPSS